MRRADWRYDWSVGRRRGDVDWVALDHHDVVAPAGQQDCAVETGEASPDDDNAF
jgi:hypothetical protein